MKEKIYSGDKFFEDLEERNKEFWGAATEGWNILEKVGKGALKLIIIIIATPFAFIGVCKKWLKKR